MGLCAILYRVSMLLTYFASAPALYKRMAHIFLTYGFTVPNRLPSPGDSRLSGGCLARRSAVRNQDQCSLAQRDSLLCVIKGIMVRKS